MTRLNAVPVNRMAAHNGQWKRAGFPPPFHPYRLLGRDRIDQCSTPAQTLR